MTHYSRKRVRIKPRFYVIVTIFLALLIWGCRAVFGGSARVEWGDLETSRTVTAIVIRDESVIRAASYAKINCLAAEGEVVEAGVPIAELYTSGYSEKDLQNMITLQKTIKEYQQNNILKNIVDPTLEDYNTKISAKLEEISQSAVTTKVQNLPTLERELTQLMNARQAYMRSIVAPDDQLLGLYQKETDLQQKIDANKQILGLRETAAVSFFLDGYEEKLNANMIDSLTVKSLNEVCREIAVYGDSTAQGGNLLLSNEPLLRAVNPSYWFLAFTMPAKDNTLVEGIQCEMTLEGGQEGLIPATVYRIRQEGGTVLVVLRIEQPMGAMLRLRKITAHIGRNAEGFRVPLKAVYGGDSVTVVTSVGVQTVPVEIVASNSKFAIIREKDGGNTLGLKQKLVMP